MQATDGMKSVDYASRTYDWPEFWYGHHGFARILREVRIIPGGDGVIQRICKFFV